MDKRKRRAMREAMVRMTAHTKQNEPDPVTRACEPISNRQGRGLGSQKHVRIQKVKWGGAIGAQIGGIKTGG